MALGKNLATGRFDADQSAVMKRVRKPRFVDNAVRHGEYTKQPSGFVVNRPTKGDFIPTPERRYTLIEEEDTVKLIHSTTDGHRYEGALFFDEDKVTTSSTLPALFVGAENHGQSLAPSSIETSNKGTRYRLENLKGRTLNDIGFTDKSVHIAQKVDVGLRTSDLASKVAKSTTSSINGIVTRAHSTTFIAHDFYGVHAVNALRFLAKHDGYGTRGDQFGNLYYVAQGQYNREHLITENRVAGGIYTDQNESVPNRVVVRGKPRANNEHNVVQVDDFGPQKTSVNEVPGGISVPTALTRASARRVGQKMLTMAKKSTGSERLTDVMASSHVHPGDVVSYQSRTESKRKIVLGAKHKLTERMSELHINSVESTLEDVLQSFQEVDVSGNEMANSERNRQFSTEEFVTAAGFNIKVSWQISERRDENRGTGFSIGEPNRSTIKGEWRPKGTGVLINNGGGYPIGTSTFTVDGLSASVVFTTDNAAVYTNNGNKLGHVDVPAILASGSPATTVILQSPSVHSIADDEELLIASTVSFAESRNDHLKIGANKSIYLKNRRG